MDIMKEFVEEYLPIWSEQKHQPIPTQKHMDRWNIAWNDFIKERLNPRWEEIAQEYKNMRYKTTADLHKEQEVPEQEIEAIEEIPEPEPEKSDWEKVQELLKKKK